MSSCSEMGEAIELRWVKYWVVGVYHIFLNVCLFKDLQVTSYIFMHMYIYAEIYQVYFSLKLCLLLPWRLAPWAVFLLCLPSVLCPSSWPCFNQAVISELCREQQEIWIFVTSIALVCCCCCCCSCCCWVCGHGGIFSHCQTDNRASPACIHRAHSG